MYTSTTIQTEVEYKYKILECTKDMWNNFSREHYLSQKIPSNNKVFVLVVNNQLACCCTIGVFPHPQRPMGMKVSRLVTLPQFQGLGLGTMLLNKVSEHIKGLGYTVTIGTSLPYFHKILCKDTRWGLIAQALGNKEKKQNNNTDFSHLKQTMRSNYTETWEYKMDTTRTKVSRRNIPKELRKDVRGQLKY